MIDVVMTTDFYIDVNVNGTIRHTVETVKTTSDYAKKRTREKLEIERRYFARRNIEWHIATEKSINKQKAQNIGFIMPYYNWHSESGIGNDQLEQLIYDYKKTLVKNNYLFLPTALGFEKEQRFAEGEGLPFSKFLMARKIIATEMNKRFNYTKMVVWINEGVNLTK